MMALDDRKIAHIRALTAKILTGRQQTVVFVTQSSGVFSYTARQVILRPLANVHLDALSAGGNTPKPVYDALLVAPVELNLLNVAYIADTAIATAEAVTAARKYALVEEQPIGMIPGGAYMLVKLRRLR